MGSGKSGQVVGYKYFLGVDFAWCHGPVDRMTNLYVDNTPLDLVLDSTYPTLSIDKANLFGEVEGGVQGQINLLDGGETQVQHPYLVTKIGSDVPAYRGVTRTLLKGNTASRAFYVGNNPYLKKWSGEFQRIYKRIVDGAVTDQWQPTIAGVPLIEDDGYLISSVLEDQAILFNVDLSSAANGYSGVNGTITGGGQDLDATKNKLINTLIYIRDNAQYDRGDSDYLGVETGGTSGLTLGVSYFRYTDGASNNNTNFISPGQEGTGIESLAPLPTDLQKINDTYDAAYNFPKRGVKMYENITTSQIDDLIEFVSNFVVVPDNIPDGGRFFSGTVSTNVTNGFATVTDTSIRYSHILYSPLISDDSNFGIKSFSSTISTTLNGGTGLPVTVINHAGLDTENKALIRNALIWPSTSDNVSITGGWVQVGLDTSFTGGADYMKTLPSETSPTDAVGLVLLPSGDTADVAFGAPPDNAKTWYWGPLITGGLYTGRFDVEEVWTRSTTGPTTVLINGRDFFTELSRDISGEENIKAGDTLYRVDPTVSSVIAALGTNVASYVEMNPAHIIRECLTDQQWGIGLPEADIDETTFAAAAQTLYDERFGLSLAWFRQEPIEDFINVILNHIDAVLYVSRVTGTWVLKLIRDDYDPETLTEYTDADVVDWSNISIKGPAELTNSVTINYNSRELRGQASLTVNNLAQVQQLGSVINTTVTYPGIWQPKLATRVAQRDLTTLSTALIGGEISVTRKGYNLNPGDVFKLTSSRYNLSGEIMRVVEVKPGDGLDNKIGVSFTQDKFNLSTGTDFDIVSVPDPESPTISNVPEKVTDYVLMEYPYYFFARLASEAEAAARETEEPGLGFISYTGVAPTPDSIYAIPSIDDGAGFEDYTPSMPFCPHATLSADVDEHADTTALSITDFTYYTDLSVGDLLMVGDEIMKIASLDSETQITVGRGCLDTVPAFHRSGLKVFFISDTLTPAVKEFVDAETINVKLLTVTGKGQLDRALAPSLSYTFDSRITRPYPVAKLQLDGAYSSVWDTSSGATTTATWVHRDRTLQTDENPADFTDASVGPEAGSDYTISAVAYDFKTGEELAGNLFSTNKAQLLSHVISSDAYSPTTEGTDPWSAVGVRVNNIRDTSPGYENFQTPEVLAYYPVTPEETEGLNGFWVDVNILASVTQDPDGLTPVVYDGDPVGAIANQRGF